jgi:hypothetical protein
MAGPSITLVGMEDAQKQLDRIVTGIEKLSGMEAIVGSRRPYAFGIEEGYHEVSGTLARRVGGAQYLQGAVNTVLSGADSDLSAGLTKVTAPGPWVLRRLARWARRLARADVPRVSGTLRRSIIADVRAKE